MGFSEAVWTCLREKYVTFSGRAPRSEFWFFTLFLLLVVIAFGGVFFLIGGLAIIQGEDFDSLVTGAFLPWIIAAGIAWLALLLPSIAVTFRRFHDVNLSGGWYVVCFVVSAATPEEGFLAIVGLVIGLVSYGVGLIKGTEGDNKYGPDPLAEQIPADIFA